MSDAPSPPAPPAAPTAPGGVSRLLIDVGPLLVFFLANFFAPVPHALKIFAATGAFMAAMIAALIYSAIRFRHVSALLLFSGAMVVVLGGLTIWLHNDLFIKVKPTIYYSLVAALLGFGYVTGRPILKSVLGSTYPGLDDGGWRKLTRNWAVFFIAMALANEYVWRHFTTDQWVVYKLWLAIPATLLFAAANLPMLLKHGLNADAGKPVEPGPIE